ncbi:MULTISPECIES: DUF6301 family protein [Actinomyces]|uniref:Uncharacterized protein n=1 Tax=Actinomyces respiraculi TaxID=2744574 RepID=A0A7T0LLQ1_9ACTO|nr:MULTISPECIES: DUF6301 family protein [Actinomyces]QPL06000.1 hypothetical protein ID810_03355 [Actinomyces respiraculi]
MKMETLPVETAVEWITAWTNLTWPVSWDTAFAIRDQLGWTPYSEDGMLFTTVLTPPGEKHGGYMTDRDDSEFNGVTFPLATRIVRGMKDKLTAPTTWAAYKSYVTALTKTFGAPRHDRRNVGADNEHRQSTWYLENGSSFSLTAMSGIISVYINSPESTYADLESQRLEEKYGPDWEELIN